MSLKTKQQGDTPNTLTHTGRAYTRILFYDYLILHQTGKW